MFVVILWSRHFQRCVICCLISLPILHSSLHQYLYHSQNQYHHRSMSFQILILMLSNLHYCYCSFFVPRTNIYQPILNIFISQLSWPVSTTATQFHLFHDCHIQQGIVVSQTDYNTTSIPEFRFIRNQTFWRTPLYSSTFIPIWDISLNIHSFLCIYRNHSAEVASESLRFQAFVSGLKTIVKWTFQQS